MKDTNINNKNSIDITKTNVSSLFKYDKKVIAIFYANVNNLNIEENIHKLPQIRQQKANKYKFLKDKRLSVGVYLLLAKALDKYNLKITNYEFKYENNGKPFLSGCPLHFSLSHSGDLVAVAISDDVIGVDIQETRDFDIKLTEMVFNDNDRVYFEKSNNKKQAFYKIWTHKESYIKMTGEGLKKNFKDIFINYEDENSCPFYKNYPINGYIISICVPEHRECHIEEITL